jgi:excisionase family DNA binding protein
MQNRSTIEKVFAESASTGPKPLPMGAPQFPPFSPVVWYTAEEAATLLRVTERGIGRFIRRGRLKGSWVGRRWLISNHNIEAFLQGQEQSFA